MARHRFRRHFARSRAAPARRVHHRRSGGMSSYMPLLGAAAYGAGRQYIKGLISPLTNMIPLGQYAEPAGLILTAWAAKKFIPAVAPVANAAMMIEAAQIGANVANGMGIGTSTSISTGLPSNIKVLG